MKLSKRIITLLSAVLMVAMLVPSALAVSDASAEAGKSVTVTFTFKDIYNVDGAFALSDPQKILSAYSISIADDGATDAHVKEDRLWASPTADPVKTTVSVDVVLNIKSTAAVGSKCTVSFTGIYGDANKAAGNEQDITQTATVTVKSATGDPTTSAPVVEPTPTPGGTTTPAGSSVDYAELTKQITVANGLNLADYTNESRDILNAALSAAQNAMNSDKQSEVTAAADKLRAAINGMVAMDYSRLKAALTRADALLASEQAATLWDQLSETAVESRQLLQSGDQQAVDQAAGKLENLLTSIAVLLDADSETKVVIQEKPVEVLPSDDYCNIGRHHLWTVLLVVSAVLNLCFIGLIVTYVIRKTKNRRDETPLVDYDIDDDF